MGTCHAAAAVVEDMAEPSQETLEKQSDVPHPAESRLGSHAAAARRDAHVAADGLEQIRRAASDAVN